MRLSAPEGGFMECFDVKRFIKDARWVTVGGSPIESIAGVIAGMKELLH